MSVQQMLRSQHVLVVDDSAGMRELLTEELHRVGLQDIDQFADGVEALEALERNPYGLVVTDWQMPRMSGVELLREIRARAELKHLPVLIVTGYVTKDRIIEAAQAGVTGFVMKPYISPMLGDKARLLVGRAHRPQAPNSRADEEQVDPRPTPFPIPSTTP